MKRWLPIAAFLAFALSTGIASAQTAPTPAPWNHGGYGGPNTTFTPNPNWSPHPRASYAPGQNTGYNGHQNGNNGNQYGNRNNGNQYSNGNNGNQYANRNDRNNRWDDRRDRREEHHDFWQRDRRNHR